MNLLTSVVIVIIIAVILLYFMRSTKNSVKVTVKEFWKQLGNKRLPPVMKDYWEYSADSFTWEPKPYDNIPEGLTGKTYWDWIDREKSVPAPLMLRRGGLTENAVDVIVDSQDDFPDLRTGIWTVPMSGGKCFRGF